MPHSRRYFESKKTYSVCFKVREGLPFVATHYMKLLLGGIIARTQRDYKVTLCQFVWMATHVHILLVCHDAYQLSAFYAEIQKKITDSLKALLGKQTLRLWQGRAMVAQVLDIDAAKGQLAYFYANPSRAHLIDTIEQYPGFTTYQQFRSCPSSINAAIEHTQYWVPASKLPRLPALSMRKHQDLEFTSKLKKLAIPSKLILYPNAWMETFRHETDRSAVAETNASILRQLRSLEAEYRQNRIREGLGVLGERALRTQAILKEYTPSPIERRAFVITTDNSLRVQFIIGFRQLCDQCAECFRRALAGITANWPPGVFRPSLRLIASAL